MVVGGGACGGGKIVTWWHCTNRKPRWFLDYSGSSWFIG